MATITNQRTRNITPDTEKAWAAGIWDGEGSATGYQNGPYWRPLCKIDQKTRPLLDRFQRAVKIGTVYGPYISNKGHRSYCWKVGTPAEVMILAGTLWPYLCRTKKQQFTRVLKKWRKSYKRAKIIPINRKVAQ